MRRLLAIIALLVVACSPTDVGEETTQAELASTTSSTTTSSTTTSSTTTTAPVSTTSTEPPDLAITSPTFNEGERIPAEFTCDGLDINPELKIVGLPEGTISIVLIVDDPDAPAGTWDHWVEFDIEAGPGSHDIARDSGQIGVEAVNSWHVGGYGGPCPPVGENHRYFFTVYAIDGLLGLPEGVDSETVRGAMSGRVLGTAQLMGTYDR